MKEEILHAFGLEGELPGAGNGSWSGGKGELLESRSPIDGSAIGRVRCASPADYEKVVSQAVRAFAQWRLVPAPRRGEIVRQIGQALRIWKADLGALVSLEMGKIRVEGEGEVQEMIDMADYAVGLSRMLNGATMPSERPGHRMYEQWHPLGPVGVITAFNFPVSVWAWNALLALVAGDPVIWKPSSKVPLCALAVMGIAWKVLRENDLPEGLLSIIIGRAETIGQALGKTLLELGGNNAVIVTPRADLSLAVRAIVFGAVGTAGQRCTSTRRLIMHRSIFPALREALITAYRQIPIGNPLEPGTLMGPLIDREAVEAMQMALKQLKEQGGEILYGGEVLSGGLYDAGTYVRPCLCSARADLPIVREETFAPVLYLIPYATLEEAVSIHNGVPQGLSSAIFTQDMQEAEFFLSQKGSDCGIANVNIGTSGAEIGGAFGGEKATGGGREAGSDSWKAYLRRQTCTINWSGELPLAQGIRFEAP
ncbi:MAG: aldehyde dehydrogenase family protein [Deltaproteobacteria bacterium]|nr:aldehyde dehydrogenase family protein [Deltaproteobacteria bacterium]